MNTAGPIDNTFGALLIGVVVAGILYGMTNLQTYMYFAQFHSDTEGTRTLVLVIWILDTFHVALILKAIYYYVITNYSNPSNLDDGYWSLFVSVAVNLVISLLVQCFFTFQIFQLCSPRARWPVTISIAVLIAAHFGLGVETVALLFVKKKLTKLPELTLIAATPFAVFAVLSDIAIAAALCILLHGSRTIFTRTNALITNLIVYAVNRCLLTSVVAIVEVVVFVVAPHTLWFLAVDFTIGKLWANSMLASLNSRIFLKETNAAHSMNTLSHIQFEEATTGTSVLEIPNSPLDYTRKRPVSDPGSNLTRSSERELHSSQLKYEP